MDLLPAVAALMESQVPFEVMKPLIDVLPIDWNTVPALTLVEHLVKGSREDNVVAKGKDLLAEYVLPRLSWSSQEADLAMTMFWKGAISVSSVRRNVALAATQSIAAFGTPEGRSAVLPYLMVAKSYASSSESMADAVNNVLAMGCITDVPAVASPFLTVTSIALFEALRHHGFSLISENASGKNVADMVREREPDTFESHPDRQKILAALPMREVSLEQRLLDAVKMAKRWSDVKKTLNEVGPAWLEVRFENGDSIVHKVFDKDPDWAQSLLNMPIMATAPADFVVDGKGHHLMWRTVWMPSTIVQPRGTYNKERPPSRHVPGFDESVFNGPFGQQWAQWPSFTRDATQAWIGVMEAHHDYVTNVCNPRGGASAQRNYRNWADRNLMHDYLNQMGTTFEASLINSIPNPAFQDVFDRLAFHSKGKTNAYGSGDGLINFFQNKKRLINIDRQWSPATRTWIANHILVRSVQTLHEEGQLDVALKAIKAGADWSVIDAHVQAQRVLMIGNTRQVWNSTLHHAWEAPLLEAAMQHPASKDILPPTPARRRL